jgi:hypothetical protein
MYTWWENFEVPISGLPYCGSFLSKKVFCLLNQISTPFIRFTEKSNKTLAFESSLDSFFLFIPNS